MTWITLDPPLPYSKVSTILSDAELGDIGDLHWSKRPHDPLLTMSDAEIAALTEEDLDREMHVQERWYHNEFLPATEPAQRALDARKTFCTEGLNRVGVQFEIEGGRRFLIGDCEVEGVAEDFDNRGTLEFLEGNRYRFALVTRYRDLLGGQD
jgi:hypothetical protein